MDPLSNNVTPTKGSQSSSEGRYAQRLRQLEDENRLLRSKIDELCEWKQRMEEWMYDQFEVQFPQGEVQIDVKNNVEEVENNSDHSPNAAGDPLPSSSSQLRFSSSKKILNGHASPSPTSAVSSETEAILPKRNSSLNINTSDNSSSSMSTSPVPPKKRKTEPEKQPVKIVETILPAPSVQGVKSEPPNEPLTSASSNISKQSTPSSSNGTNNGLPAKPYKPGPKSKKLQMNQNDRQIDEEARCSVCDDKYAEDKNEMVFCDKCNICVHQACYGVKTIPEAEWFCKPCELGIEKTPQCIFCPNPGGAMVPVRTEKNKSSGQSWAHVFCAMWIKEVTFLNPDDIDLVINVNRVHKDRWRLKCSLCKLGKGHGACIQCQWKNCATAFHVTCASRNKLKMEGVLDDNLPGGVALLAFCHKHRNMP